MSTPANANPGTKRLFLRVIRTGNALVDAPAGSTFSDDFWRIAACFDMIAAARAVGTKLTPSPATPALNAALATFLKTGGNIVNSVSIGPAQLGATAPSEGLFSIRSSSGQLLTFRLNGVKERLNVNLVGVQENNLSQMPDMAGSYVANPYNPLSKAPILGLQLKSGVIVYTPSSSFIGYDQVGQFFLTDYSITKPESFNGFGYSAITLTSPSFRKTAISELAVPCPLNFMPVPKLGPTSLNGAKFTMTLEQEFEIEYEIAAELPPEDGVHAVVRTQWRTADPADQYQCRIYSGQASPTHAMVVPPILPTFGDTVRSGQTVAYLAVRIDDVVSPDQRSIQSVNMIKGLDILYDNTAEPYATPPDWTDAVKIAASSVSLL